MPTKTKGLTNQPLILAVFPGWFSNPAILDLAAKGHTVLDICRVDLRETEVDVFITPSAGWDEANLQPRTRKNGAVYYPFCDQAVLLARRAKKERKTNGD